MSMHMARMNQVVVEGEVVAVTLELLKEDAQVQLRDGDEFYTVAMRIDPWVAQ